MSIGARIKKYRLTAKLTQEELAKLSGITRVSIGNYERDERTPPADSIMRIASALKVPVATLLSDTYNPTTHTAEYDFGTVEDELIMQIAQITTNTPEQLTAWRKRLLNEAFDKLNDKGQDKAIEHVEVIAGNKKYQKNPEE